MAEPDRHLAAILSADAVGYSRLMAADEAGTIRSITAARREFERIVGGHQGRVVDSPGDNILVELRTALDAVTCAVELQRALKAQNADLPEERQMAFRIGVHLGDVASEDGKLYGTGVNVAARLESLAEAGGICISSEVHGQVEGKLELGFEDLGEQSVKNIPKPVRVLRVLLEGEAERRPKRGAGAWTRARIVACSAVALVLLAAAGLWLSWPAPMGLVLDLAGLTELPENPPLPDKPSIVVLPFDNMSNDPEQEYFADGMVEDLTTDLSRNPRLFVIARNTAFTYKGTAFRVEDVGRELGVRYAVEGSVRRAGGRVRVNVQLIDATSGLHLWSERYDRELTEIFSLQNEIVKSVFESVGVEVLANEMERASRRTTDLGAYDAFMKGVSHFALARGRNLEARRWFQRAIELDPAYGDPHALMAISHNAEHLMGWDLDPVHLELAKKHARRCLELAPELASCWNAISNVELAQGRPAEAARHAEKAIELEPSFFAGHFALGLARVGQGQPLRAIESVRRAIRLNPRGDSIAGALAFANFRAGREAEAVEIWERIRASKPDFLPARILLASLYEADGDRERARTLVEEIRAVNPDLTVDQLGDITTVGSLGPEVVSTIQQHLRSAGLPDRPSDAD